MSVNIKCLTGLQSAGQDQEAESSGSGSGGGLRYNGFDSREEQQKSALIARIQDSKEARQAFFERTMWPVLLDWCREHARDELRTLSLLRDASDMRHPHTW